MAPALSALGSVATLALLLRSGYAGPLDKPNQRSLHVVPVPRSGGVGIMIGVIIGAVVSMPTMALLLGLILLVIVSWWDDRRPLPVPFRLLSQVVAGGSALTAGYASQWGDWGSLGLILALFWIVWMTNLYNFMDGANGLAGGMALFGFGAYAFVAGTAGNTAIAIWASCIAAAAAGFLVFNFDPARIFMGDVGSVPLGYLAAVLGLEGMRLELWPIWFPILVFSPFIADASVTLIKRGVRGDKVWIAHREHYYQRLIRFGWSHRKLAVHEYGLMVGTSASACVMLSLPASFQGAMLLVWILILGSLMAKVESVERKK